MASIISLSFAGDDVTTKTSFTWLSYSEISYYFYCSVALSWVFRVFQNFKLSHVHGMFLWIWIVISYLYIFIWVKMATLHCTMEFQFFTVSEKLLKCFYIVFLFTLVFFHRGLAVSSWFCASNVSVVWMHQMLSVVWMKK